MSVPMRSWMLLVVFCLVAATYSNSKHLEGHISDLPDYDTYRVLERRRLQQQRQESLGTTEDNATVVTMPAQRTTVKRAPANMLYDVLRFLHANRVLFYLSCGGILTAVLLLFTLAALHMSGGLGSHRSSAPTMASAPEEYPLLSRERRHVEFASDDDESSPTAPVTEGYDCFVALQPERAPAGDSPVERTHVLSMRPSPEKPTVPVFPKQLLELCNQDVPLSFVAFLPNGNYDRTRWVARGKHSEVFQVVSLLKKTILKVIPLLNEYTDSEINTLTLGVMSHMKLSSLRYGLKYRTPNFIEIQRVACVYDTFPEWLLKSDRLKDSYDSTAESLLSEVTGISQCTNTRRFIVIELCYAGRPLSRIKMRSSVQGRSLIQQIACSVAVAERSLGFAHLTTDADKVLVSPTDLASIEYRIDGRAPLCVEAAGLKAHISGSLSCMVNVERLRGEALDDMEQLSQGTHDNGSKAERFYNNVMWVGAVFETIISKLHSDVQDSRIRSEGAVISQLHSWHNTLHQCSSVDQFVMDTFL
ncbi:serine/threonine-protein kinase haspin-like [Ornithodoros turicata]|uniref:serine/threonine-protein kinase haspin-like n=1 Tax=Ornithodoros turicata TaxID=34597 RepID=UPI003139676E